MSWDGNITVHKYLDQVITGCKAMVLKHLNMALDIIGAVVLLIYGYPIEEIG
jgi:hypothetical protein